MSLFIYLYPYLHIQLHQTFKYQGNVFIRFIFNKVFSENNLFIGSMQIELETVIKQVIPLYEIIFVLFDPLADNFHFVVSNLIGIDYSGNEVRRAVYNRRI